MFFGQFARMVLVVFAVVLLGAGCKKEISVAPPGGDTGTTVPKGWQVYRSDKWRVGIGYPREWYSGELSSDPLVVAFGNQPIVAIPESDVTYPVMFSAREESLATALDGFGDDATRRDVTIAGIPAIELVYLADLLGQNDTVYLFHRDGYTYSLQSLEKSEFRDEFEQMLQTISLGGK